jgi:serine/threonine-protein kinase ATR
MTGKLDMLQELFTDSYANDPQNFNVSIAKALIALKTRDHLKLQEIISEVRENIARSLTPATTQSLSKAHESALKLHAVYELEAISDTLKETKPDRGSLLDILNRRLDIIGAFTDDKQYLLGIRRAAMQLSE